MMLTIAMPAMKRSDLIMALVPLRLPSPTVPKKYGWVPLWVSENLRIGPGDQGTYFFDTTLSQRPRPAGRVPLGAGEWNFCDLLAISTTYETRLPRGNQDESALPGS
jgi:hypothetical protein